MTHLCWYYLGRDVKVVQTSAVPVFVMDSDGEWVKHSKPIGDRRAKAICSKNVSASEITSRVTECECAECIRIHNRDVDPR